MQRLPKKREEADVLMSLSLSGLDASVFYDETDINRHLSAWLNIIVSENGLLDYVTLRRSLVDCGFLRRASDGAVYRVVSERVDGVLSSDARRVDPKWVFAEVESDRNERRARFGPRD